MLLDLSDVRLCFGMDHEYGYARVSTDGQSVPRIIVRQLDQRPHKVHNLPA